MGDDAAFDARDRRRHDARVRTFDGRVGATVMLAYYPRTMPVQIWVSFRTLGLDVAFPITVLLVLVSIGAIALLNVLGSNL